MDANADVDAVVATTVGEKRAAEAGDDAEEDVLGARKRKKKARGVDEMKRVAEIVLVLSAMGGMRGGRVPSNVEKELMAEAREKLALICEGIAPKDIVPRDAVRVVIEDLGLNNSVSKDQRLGFRPPKMSILEKLQLTKRKMEESKKFAAQSGIYSSQMLSAGAGFGAKAESHGPFSHAGHRFSPDKPSHTAVAAGGYTSPTVNASSLSLASSSNLLPANESQSALVSRGPFSSHLERDLSSLPLSRSEVAHFRLDGISNGSAYASQGKAISSGDHSLEKAPTCSPQIQSGAVNKVGMANKVTDHKVGGSPEITASQAAFQVTKERNSQTSPAQTTFGNLHSTPQPSQARNFVPISSLYNNHNDIARNVQKFLQPRPPQHPNWTPPSTDYMNKSLTCQICKLTINDVESLLVCDACEKGVHLKCLQSYNQKGIPKGEWHCPKCLISSNGKPLPPKYGRVTRSISAHKVFQSTIGVQPSTEKKAENSDQKVSHQKITTNGNPGSLNSAHVQPASDLKMLNPMSLHGANFSSSEPKLDKNSLSELNSLQNGNTGLVPALSEKPKESSNQLVKDGESSPFDPDKSTLKPNSEPDHPCPEDSSNTGANTFHKPQGSYNSPEVNELVVLNSAAVSSSQCHEVKTPDLVKNCNSEPQLGVRNSDHDIVGTSGFSNGVKDLKSSLDGLRSVEWIGDVHQVVDEKAFYKSCNINGRVYKLQDHALFCSNNGDLRPSKLQAFWEDTKTGLKWANVHRCYFPGDLPEAVGRPCTPETNEVYESNHRSTVGADLIQGPCEVFPPNKFKEESERRSHLHREATPVFLCKWFYDEAKGAFRPVTD